MNEWTNDGWMDREERGIAWMDMDMNMNIEEGNGIREVKHMMFDMEHMNAISRNWQWQ